VEPKVSEEKKKRNRLDKAWKQLLRKFRKSIVKSAFDKKTGTIRNKSEYLREILEDSYSNLESYLD